MFPGSSNVKQNFAITYLEIPASTPTTIGALLVTAELVIQGSGAPSFALRVECNGKTIVYTGDTEWTDSLIKIASGADLFGEAKYRGFDSLRLTLPQGGSF